MVFDRVKKEDVLLEFDFNRLRKILIEVFLAKEVEQSEILYLRRKARTIERKFKNTFTELYLSNLVYLFSEDNAKILDKYQSGEMGASVIFMPEIRQKNVIYSPEDVDQVKRQLEGHLSGDDCVMLELRAGIFLSNESVRNIHKLLREFPQLMLYLRSEPYDIIKADDLLTAMKIVGLDRIITEFPPRLIQDMKYEDPGVVPVINSNESGTERLNSATDAASLNNAASLLLLIISSSSAVLQTLCNWDTLFHVIVKALMIVGE